MKTHITELVALLANIQISHWQASSRDNTHETLGNLYSDFSKLVDKFSEVALGKSGSREIPGAGPFELKTNFPPLELLNEGFETLEEIRKTLEIGPDDDLLSIVAEMSEALNYAKYFLML
jgi:hypothetical protein